MITASAISSASILIVDDLKVNVELLTRMLASAGYTDITSTMDPTEVCGLYRQRRHDLILLDLKMPVMDGFQVMEGLKEIEKEGYLPVLVITAEPGHKMRALQAGAKDFIAKPFELPEVLVRVRNVFEKLREPAEQGFHELLGGHGRSILVPEAGGHHVLDVALLAVGKLHLRPNFTHAWTLAAFFAYRRIFYGSDQVRGKGKIWEIAVSGNFKSKNRLVNGRLQKLKFARYKRRILEWSR